MLASTVDTHTGNTPTSVCVKLDTVILRKQNSTSGICDVFFSYVKTVVYFSSLCVLHSMCFSVGGGSSETEKRSTSQGHKC